MALASLRSTMRPYSSSGSDASMGTTTHPAYIAATAERIHSKEFLLLTITLQAVMPFLAKPFASLMTFCSNSLKVMEYIFTNIPERS